MQHPSELRTQRTNDEVRSYYDINTPAFARFGQGAGEGAIRRTVWAPEVQTEHDALHAAGCAAAPVRHGGECVPSPGNEANAAARAAGFTPLESHSLTAYLELRRPRDRMLRVILPLLAYVPLPELRRRSLIGGDALQRGLLSGLIDYRYMSWRRQG